MEKDYNKRSFQKLNLGGPCGGSGRASPGEKKTIGEAVAMI